jgi:hypothetical protein
MNSYDELETQLRQATRRRHSRVAMRTAPILPLGFASLLAAAFAILVIGHTKPDPEREAAVPATDTWTPVLGDDARGHPTIARDPAPVDQTRALAILRRDPTSADRSAGVRELLTHLPPSVAGVRVDQIRLVKSHRGEMIVLVPVQRLALSPRDSSDDVADALCLLSGDATAVASREPAGSAGAAGARNPSDSSRGVVGMTCGSLGDVFAGRLGWPASPRGLAPDGVARARLHLRGGGVVDAPVSGNFYDMRDANGAESQAIAIGRPTWLDAEGKERDFTSRPAK